MISTIYRPFGPLPPLLLCVALMSGYSNALLAAAPVLVSPENKTAVLDQDALEYEWEPVEGATEYAFSIRDQRLKQVIYNSDETIRLMAAEVCPEQGGNCKISAADTMILENFGRYSWRVKAFNQASKKIGVNRSVFFVSAGAAPETPVIEAPRDNQDYALPSKPSFEWAHSLASGPADFYIVRVVDITNSGDRKLLYRAKLPVSSACSTDACSYTLNPEDLVQGVSPSPESGELPLGKYRFTVRASNGYDRSLVARVKFTVNSAVAEGAVAEGYDWALPQYVTDNPNTNGGLVRDTYPMTDKPEGYSNTAFFSVRWIDGFNPFNYWFNLGGGKDANVLVRLEVNSVCDVPDAIRSEFSYYGGGSIAFWQPAYLDRLKVFVDEFATRYAGDPRIKGVHLGIADGEYTQIASQLAEHIKAGGSHDDFDYAAHCNEPGFNSFIGDDGWGEFFAQEGELKSALSLNDGLTVEKFQSSVKAIIDMYTDAFNPDPLDPTKDLRSKLAMTNLANFVYNDPFITSDSDPAFVEDEVIEAFNRVKTTKISPYALAAGVGNRDGLIEDWMSYNNPVYGVSYQHDDATSPVGTCKMIMDEGTAEIKGIADIISSRYWGTENEEYLLYGSLPDDGNYVLERYGKDDQYYRFMMSSLRALQMRRNHMQVNTNAMFDLTLDNAGVETPYKTTEFLHYLAGTLGRNKSDTPDAFVVLGERYVRKSRTEAFNEPAYAEDPSYFPAGLDGEDGPSVTSELSELIDAARASGKDALTNCTADDYTTVSEYGRWLTEVSGKGVKSNLIDLDIGEIDDKTGKREGKEPFSIPRFLPEVTLVAGDGFKTSTKYDYAARESNEFLFDINDAVVSNRCGDGAACELQVKVVFQDTVATTLSLMTGAGVVGAIETSGDQVIKTVTFTVDDTFANGLTNDADFGLVTVKDAHALPVFITRVNFMNEPVVEAPVL